METESSIQEKLSLADQEELQKCKESPVYFYNKYVRKEGQKEVTQEEYDAIFQERDKPFLKHRMAYATYPKLPNECFIVDNSNSNNS